MEAEKALYGLDDTSRKFSLRVKDVFLNKLGFKTGDGDEAFYYLNIEGRLHSGVITHVDDFNLAGTPDFIKDVISVVEKEVTVSKVKENIFRFTGLDVKAVETGIEISMEDYSNSLKDVTQIRKMDDRSEPLTKIEMKLYRKMTGKLAWLANSTRPDLCTWPCKC